MTHPGPGTPDGRRRPPSCRPVGRVPGPDAGQVAPILVLIVTGMALLTVLVVTTLAPPDPPPAPLPGTGCRSTAVEATAPPCPDPPDVRGVR